MTLWQVTAPHFCAGMLTDGGGVTVLTAPILAWAVGKTRAQLRTYFAKKGWTVRFVEEAEGDERNVRLAV